MVIDTRDFGQVSIEEEDIIQFVQPIYGFEGLGRYVFLSEEGVDSHFVWMQSVEDKNVCFILVNPAVVAPGYAPALPETVCKKLGEGELACWLILVVARQFQDSTVNLKSPIVINLTTNQAAQTILEEDLPIRHPLVRQSEEAAGC